MGCSDVSEFEHIYGQILTTPSCVYGRLFTWTRMADFNALIVWKRFIDICFSIKSSLWALTAAYRKFRRMIWSIIWSCGHRSRPRCVYCYLIETTGDFTWKKLKACIQLCDFRVGQATTGILVTTAMTQPPPLFSHIFPPTSAPPIFNEGLGYHDAKIMELMMFVGTFYSILAV